MGCVTASYRRDRSRSCRTARTVRADAFSYHPHPILMAPDARSLDPDDAAIADLGHLESVLDRTTRAGVVKPVRGRRFPIHLTEFGYQTNPPDPNVGVSTTRQARWVGSRSAQERPRVELVDRDWSIPAGAGASAATGRVSKRPQRPGDDYATWHGWQLELCSRAVRASVPGSAGVGADGGGRTRRLR